MSRAGVPGWITCTDSSCLCPGPPAPAPGLGPQQRLPIAVDATTMIFHPAGRSRRTRGAGPQPFRKLLSFRDLLLPAAAPVCLRHSMSLPPAPGRQAAFARPDRGRGAAGRNCPGTARDGAHATGPCDIRSRTPAVPALTRKILCNISIFPTGGFGPSDVI